ncbi:hypothetical protein J25TS5_45340 [Paenibacillus faecis]|nr:hypothetical protein J25TS5_45340 [Paenibacillus faecis]
MSQLAETGQQAGQRCLPAAAGKPVACTPAVRPVAATAFPARLFLNARLEPRGGYCALRPRRRGRPGFAFPAAEPRVGGFAYARAAAAGSATSALAVPSAPPSNCSAPSV